MKISPVKIILLIFFISFGAFLYWYLSPEKKERENENIQNNDLGTKPIILPGFENETGEGRSRVIVDEKENESQKERVFVNRNKIPELRQISDFPIVGLNIEKMSKKAKELYNEINDEELKDNEEYYEIVYMSAANAHVFRTYDFKMSSERISNITIPRVFDIKFFNNNEFIIRYLKDGEIKTYSIKLRDKEDKEIKDKYLDRKNKILKEFSGLFFPNGIIELAINKDLKKVFYLSLENKNRKKDGKIYGFLSGSFGDERKEIFEHSMKEWNINFNSKDKIAFSNKASSDEFSLSFVLDLNKNTFEKMRIKGEAFNILPNYTFDKIAFSKKDENGKIMLFIYDLNKNKILETDISAMIDKCVWAKSDNLYCATNNDIRNGEPDKWYMGESFYKDYIYVYDAKNGGFNVVYVGVGKDFDIMDLKIDEDEKYLYWIDRKSMFGWSFRLEE